VQEQCLFFGNLNNIIEKFLVDKEQKIVAGGDFNIALDSDLDCSGGNPSKKIQLKTSKIYAYRIVLPWTQNHTNFNINFSTDVLPRMSSLAKLG